MRLFLWRNIDAIILFYHPFVCYESQGALCMGIVGNLHLERGIAHKIEGQYDEAIRELKTALEEEPDNAEAYHQLGLVYGFIGEFDLSMVSLQKAVELNGSNLVARNDLALTYSMLGMYDEAKEGFEEVLRIDPSNEVARKNILFFS
jgi:tetratricopeptide (TPR) repeat protein